MGAGSNQQQLFTSQETSIYKTFMLTIFFTSPSQGEASQACHIKSSGAHGPCLTVLPITKILFFFKGFTFFLGQKNGSLTHFQTHDFTHTFSLKQLCQDENNLGQCSVVPATWLGRTGAVPSKAVPGPLPTLLSWVHRLRAGGWHESDEKQR